MSTGLPKTNVPDVVGQSRDEAVSELVSAGLKANVVAINSLEPVNTVLATAPKAGTELIEGATVRVNVSKGPKPITVPNVIGSAFESAQSTLQGAGFAVAREEVEDPAAAGTCRRPEPGRRNAAEQGIGDHAPGLRRARQTSQVPDVTSQTEADARAQLQQSGFEVQVVEEIVNDLFSTAWCSRRIRRAAATPSRARRW